MNREKLHVLQVVNSLEIGGLEKVVINLVNHQVMPDRISFSVLCLENKGALSDFITEGTPIHALDKYHSSYLKLVRKFADIIREEKIDIIHCHNYAPLFFSVLVKVFFARKVKIVYTEHNQVYNISKKHYRRFSYLLRFADRIITVSRDLENYFKNAKLSGRAKVIWNGIPEPVYDNNHIAELKKRYRQSDKDIIIGTAVVMSRQKGLTYLVQAATGIISKYPQVKFLLVGDGNLKEAISEQVRELNLEKYFFFPGYQKNVPDYLKIFDIFIMPSLWEGFSIALLEALATGVPIITTDVGGNSEIIKPNETGFLVPAKEPEAIKAAICRLIDDFELRKILGTNGKQRFRENFTVYNMAKQYSELYIDLMYRA